jgi:general stress protein 26
MTTRWGDGVRGFIWASVVVARARQQWCITRTSLTSAGRVSPHGFAPAAWDIFKTERPTNKVILKPRSHYHMNDTPTPTPAERRAHFHSLLTQFSTAMLVTHGPEGCLRARPMAVARIEDDSSVWFITSRDSPKTAEIKEDRGVLVVCQNDRSAYLSMCGQAELVRDQTKIDELWQELFKVWFPGGKEDPTLS